MENDVLRIAGKEFHSRLIVGTGKYRSFQEMARAHEASGAEIVTVAVRRVNLTDRSKESLLDYIDRTKLFILPNTAGCYSADEAIRTARLAREVGLSNWIKLEVIGDEKTLFPDNFELVKATEVLAKEGFVVMPYTNDDLISARRLIDAGAAVVMPLGAPIGSGLGIQNPTNIRILREMITQVPLIIDAGVGTASDAAFAMELGADAVLMNTGIAGAQDSVLMAQAMKNAVLAGRQAFLAGRMPKKLYATASSPAARRCGVISDGACVPPAQWNSASIYCFSNSLSAARISSLCSWGFTPVHTLAILPLGSIRKVLREAYPLSLQRAVFGHDLLFGIRQKLERQALFRAEVLMAFAGVHAHPKNHRVLFLVFRKVALKVVGLDRAARRVVLGIEVKHHPLAAKIFQAHFTPVLRR